jgi:NO-binding membrane sensor protein with MHYT domain
MSAVAYGFAVSGMHYTAMAGMHLVPPSQGSHHHVEGLARRRKCCRWSWRCSAS